MTEEESKTKWCPMAREFSLGSGAANRDGESLKMCIASDCMMWIQTDNEADPQAACMPDEEVDYLPAGHCGLAK